MQTVLADDIQVIEAQMSGVQNIVAKKEDIVSAAILAVAKGK